MSSNPSLPSLHPRARKTTPLHRQPLPFAAWSCRRPVPAPYTRRPLCSPPSLFLVLEIRPPVQAFSAASPSSIAALQADPAVVPAAIRSALPALPREPPASSPADRAPNIPHAPATQDQVDPELPAHVQALALVPASVDHPAQDSMRVPAQVAHRPPVKLPVRSARPTNAPAAALRSTPRPRKAQ
jgi:hypothetical protein